MFKSVAPENFSWHVWSPNLKLGYYLKGARHPHLKFPRNFRRKKCVSKYHLININPNFSRDAGLPGIKIKMKTHWDWVWKITIQRSGGFNFPWTLRKFYSWTCQNQLHAIRICILIPGPCSQSQAWSPRRWAPPRRCRRCWRAPGRSPPTAGSLSQSCEPAPGARTSAKV